MSNPANRLLGALLAAGLIDALSTKTNDKKPEGDGATSQTTNREKSFFQSLMDDMPGCGDPDCTACAERAADGATTDHDDAPKDGAVDAVVMMRITLTPDLCAQLDLDPHTEPKTEAEQAEHKAKLLAAAMLTMLDGVEPLNDDTEMKETARSQIVSGAKLLAWLL